jgi:hypothetical protein
MNLLGCGEVARHGIHPNEAGLIGRLRFLDKNNLNLFKDSARNPLISQPADGDLIDQEKVTLYGVVNPPLFERYEAYWGAGEVPSTWQWLSGPHLAPVVNAEITVWDTSSLSSGIYTIRVTAFSSNGKRYNAMVRVTKK